MRVAIRPARASDHSAIGEFAADTFAWGDYVPGAFPAWMDDERGVVLVAVDGTDRPIAVTRGTMLSADEAWFQGTRVAPPHRRRGIAHALVSELVTWAQGQGARVGRLLIEEWNVASRRHVERLAFRSLGGWDRAHRAVGDASPVPLGNGGRRVPAEERLRQAHSSEAEPAFLSWTSGELYRASRGLFADGWAWRRLTLDDLTAAARSQSLVEARAGWALASSDGPSVHVGWVETSATDAMGFVRALVDLAVARGAEHIQIMIPHVDWMVRAARHSGCQIDEMALYGRAFDSA